MLQTGKLFNDVIVSQPFTLYVVPRLLGGKGGFGSMLRAIGAQIEKTTNREACRDLSGRRLRDINEEKRLKTWIAQQVEREKEANDRRQKKLERLVQTPKHEFKDEKYEQERSALPEKAEDALKQGLKASSSGNKRKIEDKTKQKKKARLWYLFSLFGPLLSYNKICFRMGSDEELSSSIEDSEDDSRDEKSTSNKEDSDQDPTQKIPKINEQSEEKCITSKPSATVTSAVNAGDISDQLVLQDAVAIN